MSEGNSRSDKPDDPGREHAGIVAPPPVIFFAPLALTLLVSRRLDLKLLPESFGSLRKTVGGSLILSGAVLLALTARTMRRAEASINPYTPTENLVTHGPFGLTRNPVYLAMSLVYLGATLLGNSLPSGLAFLSIVRVVDRGVIEREEDYLSRRFGAEYRAYAARVRRWL